MKKLWSESSIPPSITSKRRVGLSRSSRVGGPAESKETLDVQAARQLEMFFPPIARARRPASMSRLDQPPHASKKRSGGGS